VFFFGPEKLLPRLFLDFELLFCQEEADGCQYLAALAEIMLLFQVDIVDIFGIFGVRLWH
jgi:hypothetical protein